MSMFTKNSYIKIIIFFCITFCIVSIPTYINSLVKGSETVVSIESTPTFPAADSDNTMLGFGWFKNGFSLEDNLTTCTFDSVYPVSGAVNLNGGTLCLNQDLLFKNITTLSGLGTIFGNNHVLDLSSSITYLPANTQVLKDTKLILNQDLVLTSTITLSGSCAIIGNGTIVDLGTQGALVVGSGATLELRDLELHNIQDTRISCADDSGKIILDRVRWVQSDDYTFDTGSMLFVDQVDLVGSSTFFYASGQTSTIDSQTKVTYSDGINFSVGRKLATGYVEPLAFTDSTSILTLDNCSLVITGSGIGFTQGTLIFDRTVMVDILGTTTTNGVIMGDGQSANDMTIQYNSGSNVTLNSGYFVYNNSLADKITATSKSAKLIRSENSYIYLAQSIVLPTMTLEMLSNNTAPIEVATDKILEYSNTRIVLPETEFDVTSNRYDQFTFYLNGSDSLFISKGIFPLKVLAINTGNKIQGNGTLKDTITLQDSSTELIFDYQGSVSQNIIMNGGLLTLDGDLHFGGNYCLTGTGTVDLNSYRLSGGVHDTAWTSTLAWEGTNGALVFNTNVDLSGTWTIKGSVVIDGNSNKIDLINGGSIVVDDGAHVTLKDLRLEHIHAHNIKCLGDTSTITLDNVQWIQDGDVTFTKGSFSFLNTVDFTGTYSFVYDSDQTSTIQSHSTWRARDGITMVMGKKNGGIEPLYFEDITSKYHLRTMSFYIVDQGMHLKHGTLIMDHEILIDIDSTSTANGIMCGNATLGTVADDFIIEYEAGSTVRSKRGHITFDNSVLPSIKPVAHKSARFIRSPGSYMYFKQNIVLPTMTIELESNSITPITVEPGKTLTYDKVVVVTPDTEFELKGSVYDYATLLLSGNGSIFLNKGLFPLYSLVMATGNKIEGTGIVNGGIILADSNAALTVQLTGGLNNNITLNGGTVSLGSVLTLLEGSIITTSGSINLGSHKINLGEHDSVWTSTLAWSGSSAEITMNSDIDLSGTWTIDGSCIINGQNNILNLNNTGQIVVSPSSVVTFKDLRIDYPGATNIRCVDDSARIIYDNVTWVQDQNYSFTTGSFTVQGPLTCLGDAVFAYESGQTSTIKSHAQWSIINDMSLHIGRKEATEYVEPLYFENGTSVLSFNDSSWVITGTGMGLYHGMVMYDHDVTLDVQSTATNNGLVIGSEQSQDDFFFQFNAGATLIFNSGHMTLKNITENVFKSIAHKTARFIRKLGSQMYINQNLTMPPFIVEQDSMIITPPVVAVGKVVSYNNLRVTNPLGEFDITGSLLNDYTSALTGAGSIFLTKGILPTYTYISGTDNKIEGNGNITGGIILANNSAEVTVSLNGAVNNNITLNGGTFILGSRLNFMADSVITGSGTINLSTRRLSLGDQDTSWTGTLVWQGTNAEIDLNSRLDLSGTWTINGSCTINGKGNTLNLGDTGTIIVDTGSQVVFKDIRLESLKSQNVRCLDDAGSIIFDSVSCVQVDDFTFDTGSMKFKDISYFFGDHTFYYDSAQTSTITRFAHWYLTGGMTLSIGRKTLETTVEPLYFEDKDAVLHFDNANFLVTSNGIQLTHGSIELDLQVTIDSTSTSTVHGIIVGDGTSNGDFFIQYNAGSAVLFNSGYAQLNNASLNTFKSVAHKNMRLIRGVDSHMFVNQDITLPPMTIELVSNSVPPMEITTGKTLVYNNVSILSPDMEIDLKGQVYSSYANLLRGNEMIFINKGTLPLYTLITGTNNAFKGNGSVAGDITLLDNSAQLIWVLSGSLLSPITLNGGLLTIGSDLNLGRGVIINGPGTVDLGNNKVKIGSKDLEWTTPVQWNSTGGEIELDGNVSLVSTWTLTGSCLIQGNNHELNLDTVGSLIVDSGATVTLRDIFLKNCSGTKIACVDDTGTLVLDNVSWSQDADFTFSTGGMSIINKVIISGKDTKFIYQTAGTTTVQAYSQLQLDDDVTFSYDPIVTASKDLLAFVDKTSQLILRGATLHTTVTGIEITKGTIIIQQDAHFKSEFVEQDGVKLVDNGITIGDGTSNNDSKWIIASGSQLYMDLGTLIYNNAVSSSWKMLHNSSALLLSIGTCLRLKESLNLQEGIIKASHAAQVIIDENKYLIGNVYSVV